MDQELLNAQNALRNNFSRSSAADNERFESTLTYVSAQPKGAETIKDLSQLDYKIRFDGLGMIKGMCSPDDKMIMINSAFMTAMAAPTFVHEATHALQLSRMPIDLMQANAADFIKASRAMEADANAHQSAFAYQARNQNTIAYDQEMKNPTTCAYVAEIEQSGDERKAMKAAFMAWYNDPKAASIYQENHTGTIALNSNRSKSGDANYQFNQSISNADIANALLFEGKPYIEPSFFNTEKARAVPETDKAKISQALTDLAVVKGVDAKKLIGNLMTPEEMKKSATLSHIKSSSGR